MAHAPGEGYVDRYSELAKVLTGARGGEPIHEVSPELLLAIVAELDRPEHHAPLGQRDWTTGLVTQIGDGTHLAAVEVINPTGSNLVTVVTMAKSVNPTGTMQVDLILDGTATGGALIKPVLLDTRLSGFAATQASSGKPDLAIGAQQVLDQNTQNSGPTSLDTVFELLKKSPVVLFPGHRLKVEAVTVNLTINVVIAGYERPLAPGEDKVR